MYTATRYVSDELPKHNLSAVLHAKIKGANTGRDLRELHVHAPGYTHNEPGVDGQSE